MPHSLVTLDIARDTEDTEDAERGVVLAWRVDEGSEVHPGQVVAEVEVGKTAIEIPATTAGTVLKILHRPDSTVPIGEVLAVIGDAGADWQQILNAARHGENGVGHGLRCRGECPECGARVAINGPVRLVDCSDCGTRSELTDEVWGAVLDTVGSGELFRRIERDPWALVVRIVDARPRCHNCERELEIERSRLNDSETATVECGGCGLGHAQVAPPAWIRARFPWVGSVLGVTSSPTARSQGPTAQCSACGASHAVLPDGAPVPRCGYCGVDIWNARPVSALPRRWYLLR